jgi:acetyltransferase-like isoleucine patch superfamily enzyme
MFVAKIIKHLRKIIHYIKQLGNYLWFYFQDPNPINELNKIKTINKTSHDFYYPEKFIKFGDYTYGYPIMMYWDDKTSLTIGKFCSIAAGVTIMLGGEHRPDWITTFPFNSMMKSFSDIEGHPHTKGDIVIGNDVWIGGGVKIMSGVNIGNGCVIGANSVVTKDIPDYCICGGVPAKIIRKRFSDEIISKLEEIKWWDFNEKEICEIIPLLQSQDIGGLIKYYETKKMSAAVHGGG